MSRFSGARTDKFNTRFCLQPFSSSPSIRRIGRSPLFLNKIFGTFPSSLTSVISAEPLLENQLKIQTYQNKSPSQELEDLHIFYELRLSELQMIDIILKIFHCISIFISHIGKKLGIKIQKTRKIFSFFLIFPLF